MQLLLTVNGMQYEVEARPTARLLDVLRDQLGLTGTKEGCAEGECGACTVIVDGKAVNSCVMLAVQARGKEILTVEGLAQDGELDALQQKFVEYGAVQCGYCTPGMLMSAKALLMGNPVPSEQDIRIALAGNLCRCTGYSAIVAAVKAAERSRRHAGDGAAGRGRGAGRRSQHRPGDSGHRAGGRRGRRGRADRGYAARAGGLPVPRRSRHAASRPHGAGRPRGR